MSTKIEAPPRPSVVGAQVRRKEDLRLLTGQGRYVSDVDLPRMRHVAFLRGPHGHARIRSVDPSNAAALSGVQAVFTGTQPEFSNMALRAMSALPTYVETDQPVLAHDRVRFMGEAVAAVVASSRYLAEDALELIDVRYEKLPATTRTDVAPEVPLHDAAPDNVLISRLFDAGDVEATLAESAVVIEREVTTNRHAGNPMECRAGVARWDPSSGRLTLWSGTQVPHIARNCIADLLDLPEGNIRVIAPDVGGGFGTKSVVYPEEVALCIIARAMPGVPVKWVEDRIEHLLAATHARDHRYWIRAGFADDGQLLALDATIDCNVGAYSAYPWTAGIEPLMAGGLLFGPYRLENYRCLTRGVATNTAPAGPYRGVARPATVFAMETTMNVAAQRLGISPVEIRRQNLIKPKDVPYRMPTRLVDDSGQYERCLEKALEVLDYEHFQAEQERRRDAGELPIGIGIACYNELTGLGRAASAGPRMAFRTGHDACTVRINPDGRVTVFSGVTSQGQGLETTIAQVVADAVGVAFEDVTVHIGDTDTALWGFGAFSSRQAVIGGGAAHRAGTAVREKAQRLAAGLLDVDPQQLRLEAGGFYLDDELAALPPISLAEVARVAYLESNRLPEGIEPGLEATRFYDPIRGAFAAGAQLAAIELDPATGALRILKWVCVEDAGIIVNPQIVEGQILGAIAQGIGGALYEHLVYDESGTLMTGTLMDYLMPTSAEMPDITIEHCSKPAENPTGVRGVGEAGTLGPNAVIAGALTDAIGVDIDRLPITPGSVWKALQ